MTPERTGTGSCRPCLTNAFIGNVCICVCVNTCVCEQGRLRAGKNAEPLRGRKMGRKEGGCEPCWGSYFCFKRAVEGYG